MAEPAPPGKEEPKGKESQAEGAESQAAPKAGGASKGPFIILGMMLLILPASGFIIAKVVLAPRIEAVKKEASEAEAESSKEKGESGEHEAKPEKSEEHGEKHAEGEDRFALSELIVNIRGTRGTRFLRAALEFEAPATVLHELQSHRAQVLDIVTSTLSAKRLEELEAEDIRQKLRIEIITLINAVLKTGEVTNVYFPDLVIQ